VKKTFSTLIIFSILFWVSLFSLWQLHSRNLQQKCQDPQWTLSHINTTVTGPYKLPHTLFLHLLGIDTPCSLFTLDLNKASATLQSFSAFKTVRLSKIPPSTLAIDYALRIPLAQLDDNRAVDKTGASFELSPFYPPLTLPRFICEEEDIQMGLRLLHTLSEYKIECIDLSKCRHKSPFRKEIVITLSHGLYLRLNPDKLDKNLSLLSRLLPQLHTDMPGTVDLRYTEYAIVSKELCPQKETAA